MTTIKHKESATTEMERMETETSKTGENLELDMKDTRSMELKTKGTHIEELSNKCTLTKELKKNVTRADELQMKGTRTDELKTTDTQTTELKTTDITAKGTRTEKLNTNNTVTNELKTRGIRTTDVRMKETRITDDNDVLPVIMGTPSSVGTPASERNRSVISVDCDVCRATRDMTSVIYCRLCKQKLCTECMVIHNRLGGTRQHNGYTETCWPESEILQLSALATSENRNVLNLQQLSSDIIEKLGIQVCYKPDEGLIEIRAPVIDILELSVDTVFSMLMGETANSHADVQKVVRHGAVEWTFRGEFAVTVAKLFRDEINSLVETYDASINVKCGNVDVTWPTTQPKGAVNFKPMAAEFGSFSDFENGEIEIVLLVSFENYYAVDCEIEGTTYKIQTLPRAEVLRPEQDEFRMKIYSIMKESSSDVICQVEKLENVHKLVIKGREAHAVEDTKQEFLGLFCKECTSCHKESSRPTFLDCKHVLCHDCVTKSASNSDGRSCPLCSDCAREKTPVTSLQLQCIQVIDKLGETGSITNKSVVTGRRKSSLRAPQLSTTIPKYLLNKWKKMTGGLTRLKAMVEHNYGFKVAGSDDNMKIYGQQQEILELAVQSLERLNEKTPVTGITQRLAEKCVEWRIRGDQARIAQFLFNKEIYGLKRQFRTVTVQAFTETEPAIVDVKCGYVEFLKVKYEMEELEHDFKNLYTDECIQPKNFYYNVKVREYLHSKRRDDKVHCSLVEKNNLNVVIIRGRKREFVVVAKEQLIKWI